MLPGGRSIQNGLLEAFRALLGAMWAQGGRRERLKSLLAVAWAQKIHVAPPGGRLGGKLIDFSSREGGQERHGASQRLPESILEASFLGTPPGPKKYEI